MKTINELQDEVIEEFSDFDDWMDKYQLLIDLGNDQQPLDPKYKTEQNLIDGCQSRVWLQADLVDGKVVFQAESDALIVKVSYLYLSKWYLDTHQTKFWNLTFTSSRRLD